MTETEPWSYHPDSSPVYSLADIVRKRAAATPAAIALAEGAGGVRPGDRVAFIGASPEDHVPAEEFEHRLRSAARPMTGSRVRVVGPVTLADCPVGSGARCWWPAPAS